VLQHSNAVCLQQRRLPRAWPAVDDQVPGVLRENVGRNCQGVRSALDVKGQRHVGVPQIQVFDVVEVGVLIDTPLVGEPLRVAAAWQPGPQHRRAPQALHEMSAWRDDRDGHANDRHDYPGQRQDIAARPAVEQPAEPAAGTDR